MSINISGFQNEIAFCEAIGLSNCFKCYAENCSYEEIDEVGFNPNSGNVYIALSNGITICSCLGREAKFLVTDWNNGNEQFFSDIDAANDFLDSVN